MRVLVFGSEQNIQDIKKKLPEESDIIYGGEKVEYYKKSLDDANLIIDFNSEKEIELAEWYINVSEKSLILINSVEIPLSLLHYYNDGWLSRIAGFNGFPGFVGNALWEISLIHPEVDLSELKQFNIDYRIVSDRVGMVGPRVIVMIINEAYYTVQEGTASRADIDNAMKLGTGYPYGPFEWCRKIGLRNVYNLLNTLYFDTHDPRYMICPLLKTEFLLEAGLY